MPLSRKDFKTSFSARCRHQWHASKVEMGALGLALRRCSRQVSCHGLRLFVLLGAQALIWGHAERAVEL